MKRVADRRHKDVRLIQYFSVFPSQLCDIWMVRRLSPFHTPEPVALCLRPV